MESLETFYYMNPSISGLKWPTCMVRQEKTKSHSSKFSSSSSNLTNPSRDGLRGFVNRTDLRRIFWLIFLSSCRSRAQHLKAGFVLCLLLGGAAAFRIGASFPWQENLSHSPCNERISFWDGPRRGGSSAGHSALGRDGTKTGNVIYFQVEVSPRALLWAGTRPPASANCVTPTWGTQQAQFQWLSQPLSQEIISKISFNCLQSVIYEELLNIYVFNFLWRK